MAHVIFLDILVDPLGNGEVVMLEITLVVWCLMGFVSGFEVIETKASAKLRYFLGSPFGQRAYFQLLFLSPSIENSKSHSR